MLRLFGAFEVIVIIDFQSVLLPRKNLHAALQNWRKPFVAWLMHA